LTSGSGARHADKGPGEEEGMNMATRGWPRPLINVTLTLFCLKHLINKSSQPAGLPGCRLSATRLLVNKRSADIATTMTSARRYCDHASLFVGWCVRYTRYDFPKSITPIFREILHRNSASMANFTVNFWEVKVYVLGQRKVLSTKFQMSTLRMFAISGSFADCVWRQYDAFYHNLNSPTCITLQLITMHSLYRPTTYQ